MKHSEAIKLLFHGWQSQADALRPEAAGLYLSTASNFTEADVTAAVHDLTQGRVGGIDTRWLPSTAAFGDYCRTVRNRRLDEEARNKPRLPPPAPIEIPAEKRREMIERLKAMNGGYLVKAASIDLKAEAEIARKAKEAVILAAFEGDPAAIAEWRAQNEAEGIAVRNTERAA